MPTNLQQQFLPAVLINSEEFRALSPTQISSFEARFTYVKEIIDNIERWLKHEDTDTTLRSFLDDLELDLAVAQNLPEEGKSLPSGWLVHSSWTFKCSASQMRAQLAPEVVSFLEHSSLPLDATAGEVEQWLRDQATNLCRILQNFHSATTFASAIAHHIAIDIVLGTLLLGTYKARLNPTVD
jgi:hypothetical protein